MSRIRSFRFIALAVVAATVSVCVPFASATSSGSSRFEHSLSALSADLDSLRGDVALARELDALATSAPTAQRTTRADRVTTPEQRVKATLAVVDALLQPTQEQSPAVPRALLAVANRADVHQMLLDLRQVLRDDAFLRFAASPGAVAAGISGWGVLKDVLNTVEALGVGLAIGIACTPPITFVGCAPAIAIGGTIIVTTLLGEEAVDSAQPNRSLSITTFACPSPSQCGLQAQAKAPDVGVSSVGSDYFFMTTLCGTDFPAAARVVGQHYSTTGKENVYDITGEKTDIPAYTSEYSQIQVRLTVNWSDGGYTTIQRTYKNPYFTAPTSNCGA